MMDLVVRVWMWVENRIASDGVTNGTSVSLQPDKIENNSQSVYLIIFICCNELQDDMSKTSVFTFMKRTDLINN